MSQRKDCVDRLIKCQADLNKRDPKILLDKFKEEILAVNGLDANKYEDHFLVCMLETIEEQNRVILDLRKFLPARGRK